MWHFPSTTEKHIFYLHMQGLFSVLLYYWYYWQRNVIYFYNLSEMSFTFVLLCFMADKHVSTCDTNTTLFSMEINYPNLCLSLPSISNASYSKCSTLQSVEELHFVQPFLSSNSQVCSLMWKFCLPPTTYTGTRKGSRNSNLNPAGPVS